MNTPHHTLAALLQQFFLERLIQQRNASAQTVAAYRDCFRLLFAFAQRHLGKQPTDLNLQDLNATVILAFLKHLEAERHNCIRSRNARCAAIRSFFHYVALKEPATLAITQAVLAIPLKRFERPLVGFFPREQLQAILNAPDPNTPTGQRDRVMLALLYNTGARVSELTALRSGDVLFEAGPAVRIHGKGRKERTVPLWRCTAAQIKQWLRQHPREPHQPLFTNRAGGKLTRTTVTERLKLAAQTAAKQYPELAKRRISPHLIRHSTAMHLLQSGVDITVIALWLGHENPSTTHTYIEADLAMKEQALKKLRPPSNSPLRYRPPDRLLQFLQSL